MRKSSHMTTLFYPQTRGKSLDLNQVIRFSWNKSHLVWSKVNLLEPLWICKVCPTHRPLTLQWIPPSNSWFPIASLVYVAWYPWSGVEIFCKQMVSYTQRVLVLCYCRDVLIGLIMCLAAFWVFSSTRAASLCSCHGAMMQHHDFYQYPFCKNPCAAM